MCGGSVRLIVVVYGASFMVKLEELLGDIRYPDFEVLNSVLCIRK